MVSNCWIIRVQLFHGENQSHYLIPLNLDDHTIQRVVLQRQMFAQNTCSVFTGDGWFVRSSTLPNSLLWQGQILCQIALFIFFSHSCVFHFVVYASLEIMNKIHNNDVRLCAPYFNFDTNNQTTDHHEAPTSNRTLLNYKRYFHVHTCVFALKEYL